MSVSAALPSLLWTVLDELEQAYVEEGAGVNGMPTLDLWANLLRVLHEGGIDRRDLPALVRLSKRAARLRISSATQRGWVEELKFDRSQAKVQLTARGSDIAARWKSLQDTAENRWRAKVGTARSDDLRACLEKVVAVLPLEHPHYPASYGVADASVTGGNGQDWKAVPRERGATVSDLPLSALMSQVLVAFAMHYEEKSLVALSLSTSVIRRIPAGGRPLKGLGHSIGVSALIRHGFVRVSGSKGGEVARLTPKGLAVSCAHDERICAVEREWRNRFGTEIITALRQALQNASDKPTHTRRPAG